MTPEAACTLGESVTAAERFQCNLTLNNRFLFLVQGTACASSAWRSGGSMESQFSYIDHRWDFLAGQDQYLRSSSPAICQSGHVAILYDVDWCKGISVARCFHFCAGGCK